MRDAHYEMAGVMLASELSPELTGAALTLVKQSVATMQAQPSIDEDSALSAGLGLAVQTVMNGALDDVMSAVENEPQPIQSRVLGIAIDGITLGAMQGLASFLAVSLNDQGLEAFLPVLTREFEKIVRQEHELQKKLMEGGPITTPRQ